MDDRLPMAKRLNAEKEHCIIVRFVPHGDPRKMLDITVALVPDKNPQGRTVWNVWHRWGSKEKFLEQFNKIWEFPRQINPATTPPELKIEDYD